MNNQHQPQYSPAPAPTFPNQQPVYVTQSAGGDDFIDWDSVDETSEFSLVPKGDYETILEKINSELVKEGINKGKSRYNCQFKITGDQYHNRNIFMDMMPHNEVSQKQVKSLALATNTPLQGNMFEVLIAAMNKKFIANVGVRKNENPSFSDRNTIWSFKPLPAVQQAPVQQMQPPRPSHIPPHAQFANGFWWVQNQNSPSGWDRLDG